MHLQHCLINFLLVLLLNYGQIPAEKINVDTLNNYSEFLNYGDKKLHKLNKNKLENDIFKSKIDVIGEIFKKNIDALKVSGNLDVVFLMDASGSVGRFNFKSELKFVKKLLSDVTVDYNHTRVAVITFSSASSIIVNIDEISKPSKTNDKCLLLNKELNNITYTGGETYTLGAFEKALEIFKESRKNSKKVLFLITDGYSNGGNPVPLANALKEQQITIFTIGIQNGNYKELYDISSQPGEFYSYLLDSYEEFESLARRALHVDLKIGDYIPLGYNRPCDSQCEEGNCCDKNALCSCGTTTGHYSCICQPGFYGTGLKNYCFPCTPGTYSDGPNQCLPCPDIHHTTTPPAFSVESCKCKLGYVPTKNNQCKVLKCPKIPIPQHGYLVKKRECGNVLNSACGVRCEVGYTLVGDSIRLCQANATWSGNKPSCEVKTCDKLPVPKYGHMNCFHSDIDIAYDKEGKLPVDTVCTFTCDKGKTLIGSSQRTCLPLARWDGLRSTCKQIKCNKLPELKFGTVDPKSCALGKQDFGKKCTFKCKEGFKMTGPAERVCTGSHGTWNSKFDETKCTDVSPPILKCPKNITSSTLPGKKFGTTTWDAPKVSDNSELEVSLWMLPSISNISHHKFEIGETQVTYFAQDAFHNKIKCSFFVSIKDTEPPIIENCVTPPIFLSPERNGTNITWDEPFIFDNSQDVKVKKSHKFGFFPIGTTKVTYTATDAAGNQNNCQLNITVEEAKCDTLPDPIYGHSDCKSDQDGVQCLITCQEGYAIPLSQPKLTGNVSVSFQCNYSEPSWSNQDGLMAPECSVTSVPESEVQEGEIDLNSDVDLCNDAEKLKNINNDVKMQLENKICIGNCTVNAHAECEIEKLEEVTNKVKRAAYFEAVPHQNRSKKLRKRINVKFQVRGKALNSSHGAMDENHVKIAGISTTIHYKVPTFLCPNGFIPRKNRCVQCPKGTFHNSTTNKCQSCPFGTYNDQLGSQSCKFCPPHYSTRKLHSKKFSDCIEQCGPGTHARKKLIKPSRRNQMTVERATLKPHCKSCAIGQYQPNFNELNCISCPPGYTTTGFGSVSRDQCIPTAQEICSIPNICNNGTCTALNEYQYYCKCFGNAFGTHCEKSASNCDSQPCYNGGMCNLVPNSFEGFVCICRAGFAGKYCQEAVDECKLNCQNGGVCLQGDEGDFCLCQNGFAGDVCAEKLTFCTSGLCENNSTCLELGTSFLCACADGYIGRRCNILPCDYRPCRNNTICVNLMKPNATKNSYQCVCPDGYTGQNCTEKIDHCKQEPCLNGGRCENNPTNYSCICNDLFYGTNCEFRRRTDYILHFSKYSTQDYIKIHGFQENLTEISACLWMQTLDSFNYGTLISYATRRKDNAFTITDYTGLVLYINNRHIVTDVLLNDGYWHHICAIWRSQVGSYWIYVDGNLMKNGTDLSPNEHIEGQGNLVIGQEQDIIGGRFSLTEAFLGKMAFIDIWSFALTEADVLNHMEDCYGMSLGNLYPWTKMMEHIYGNVEILDSTFCKNCSAPAIVYNGIINIEDNIAYYSCYEGYELSIPNYALGRKCTKASKWDGLYEPFCKKKYCGYPGFVKDATTIGNKYYFQDNVTFICDEGYSLSGNATITCREDGKWYPEKPKCIGQQCAAFKKPDKANITILSDQHYEQFKENETRFDAGTQIEITCPKEANISGENVITCTENGTWDLVPGSCLFPEIKTLSCTLESLPKPPDNGFLNTSDTLPPVGNGSKTYVEFHCNEGFHLKGDTNSTCIIDGYWTVPKTSCESNKVVCQKPQIRENMILREQNNDEYTVGDNIRFECIEGYKMIGANSIRCGVNGKWTKMIGKCFKKACRKPSVSASTQIIGNSFLYKDEIVLSCANGVQYRLLCNKNGTWEGERHESC